VWDGYFWEFMFFTLNFCAKKKHKFCCELSVIISTIHEQQCTFLSDSPLAGNGSSYNSTPVPNILPTCGMYWLGSNNNLGHLTGVVINHLAVSEFQWRDFSEHLCFGHNEHSEYTKERILRLMYDYIHVNMAITCLFPVYVVFENIPHTSIQYT